MPNEYSGSQPQQEEQAIGSSSLARVGARAVALLDDPRRVDHSELRGNEARRLEYELEFGALVNAFDAQ